METVLAGSQRINPDIVIHLTACLSAIEDGVLYVQELLDQVSTCKSIQSSLEDSFESNHEPDNENEKEEDNQNVPPAYSNSENSRINLKKEEEEEEEEKKEEEEANSSEPKIVLRKSLDLSDSSEGINLEKSDLDDLPSRIDVDTNELELEFFELRKRVDNLLIRATESDSKTNSSAITSELQKIRADLRNTVDVVKSTDENSSILEKFRLLSSEIAASCERIDGQKHSPQPASPSSPVDPVSFVESKIFELVQSVHDTNASDISTASSIKESMKKLKNTLRTLRHNEKFTQNQISRLEDLQENLADLQHEFSMLFFTFSIFYCFI